MKAGYCSQLGLAKHYDPPGKVHGQFSSVETNFHLVHCNKKEVN